MFSELGTVSSEPTHGMDTQCLDKYGQNPDDQILIADDHGDGVLPLKLCSGLVTVVIA